MKWINADRCQGQVMVELAIVTPLFLILLMLGADFGRVGFQQHKIIAAAYEGTKIVSQVEPPFFLECYPDFEIQKKIEIMRAELLKELNKSKKAKGEKEVTELPKEMAQELMEWRGRKTLCEVMEERAREILIKSGLSAESIVMMRGAGAIPDIDKMSGKTYVRFLIEPTSAEVKPGEVIYAGLEVAMPFSYFFGKSMGFQSVRLSAKLMTYYARVRVPALNQDGSAAALNEPCFRLPGHGLIDVGGLTGAYGVGSDSNSELLYNCP